MTPIAALHSEKAAEGFSLEHPQGVGMVGIVGTVGIVGRVGIVGIEFCHPEPRPTTSSVLVDISCYSYLKEPNKKSIHIQLPYHLRFNFFVFCATGTIFLFFNNPEI